jgi:hypothetical protein
MGRARVADGFIGQIKSTRYKVFPDSTLYYSREKSANETLSQLRIYA